MIVFILVALRAAKLGYAKSKLFKGEEAIALVHLRRVFQVHRTLFNSLSPPQTHIEFRNSSHFWKAQVRKQLISFRQLFLEML